MTEYPSINWSIICRSLYMTGFMKDFSKGECLRVHKLLMAKVEAGDVEKTARGLYKITRTDLEPS
jgi:hypothetical protein